MKFCYGTFLRIFFVGGAVIACLAWISDGRLPVYAMEKSPDEWITDANQSLKANPKDAKAYYNRGTGYHGKGDFEAAIKDLSAAIALEPKAPDAYFNRGQSYRKLHKFDEAIADFSSAIQLYSAQPGYYLARCAARIRTNDLDGAISDCSETIRLSPDEASAYLLRGLAHMFKGDLDEALANSAQALEIDPEYRDAKRLLLETLLKKEKLGEKVHSTSGHRSVLDHKGIKMVDKNIAGGMKVTDN